jgi:HEAT repeat protein
MVTMFKGLDDVDWRSMRHAYESAWNMPAAIRGMVSRRKDERAWAWDYLWGAVHHQGDLYDCTVAAIPFLVEAAALPEARGRAQVVRLLASIGEHAQVDGNEHAPRARRAIADAYPVFVTLLTDPKPKVRAAAAGALLACPDRLAETVPVLKALVADEPKKAVRGALIETLCVTALAGIEALPLQAWFTTLATDDPRPDVRIAALTARLRTMPDDGDDPVPVILDLLAKTDADMREVSVALGARVRDRTRLIRAVLREGPRDHLGLTRWAASRLMTDYRGDYGDLIRTCGDLLSDPDGGRRLCAIFVLADAGPLCAPAADSMVDYVNRAVEQGRAVYDPETRFPFLPGGPVWQLVHALAGLRDERALPMLFRVLDHPEPPNSIHYDLGRYGSAAEPALPWLRRRLAANDSVLQTIVRVGAVAEALPVIAAWLAGEPDMAAFWALHVAGPAAAATAPALRRLLTGPDPRLAIRAADALWAVTGDAGELLPVYERLLPAIGPKDFCQSLYQIGPAAAPLAGHVRAMLDGDWFAPVTLWTISRDVEAALPALTRAWTARRYAYRPIAQCWAEMGPAAAVAAPLLRAELAEPTRATYHGSSEAIPDDERFLVTVREALAAVSGCR